jgi:hypothetical protein
MTTSALVLRISLRYDTTHSKVFLDLEEYEDGRPCGKKVSIDTDEITRLKAVLVEFRQERVEAGMP